VNIYLPDIGCRKCDYESCVAFAEALLEKKTEPSQCPEVDSEFSKLLSSIISLNKDPIPYNTMMEQMPCELIAINNPNKRSPLLITCNFTETVSIIENLLTETGTKAFLLPTFTHGYSMDNAVHEKMFKAFEIWKAIQEMKFRKNLTKAF
jgi:CO dehydrogenase/acetyl-CoA synthase gamma subunit (corrinoid Fe-S protein)